MNLPIPLPPVNEQRAILKKIHDLEKFYTQLNDECSITDKNARHLAAVLLRDLFRKKE